MKLSDLELSAEDRVKLQKVVAKGNGFVEHALRLNQLKLPYCALNSHRLKSSVGRFVIRNRSGIAPTGISSRRMLASCVNGFHGGEADVF